MVDTKLYLIAVYLLIVTHKLSISDINSDNCLRLKVLVGYAVGKERIPLRDNIMANHSASYTQLSEYIFQTVACSDAVAVGRTVSNDNSVLS